MAALESIAPAALKQLVRELAQVRADPPEGILLIQDEENVLNVQAWIQGPVGTPYETGCFRVRLVLGGDFPQAPPKGYFTTKIFHPNVAENGEICVSTLKKDWKSDLGIKHILLTIKCLLIVPNPESALNEEAGRMLLEDYAAFAKHARLITSIHAQNKLVQFTRRETVADKPTAATPSAAGPHVEQSNGKMDGTSPAAEGTAAESAKAGPLSGASTAAAAAAAASKKRGAGEVAAAGSGPSSKVVPDKRRTMRRL
ncbi:ubiquitin-conjugating enzyme/RWD-like protein [Entophlyctis helioformis]|nr:ubiquitin-conjugating enzyme/RWD-like protein [Entophlyctis helioformis]